MNYSGKWLFRIIILLLAIVIIDFNINWPKTHANGSDRLLTTNLILMGLLTGTVLLRTVILLFKKRKKRL